MAAANRRTRQALRWLLQADKPVPERSDAEIAVEQERNFHWNFFANFFDGAFFWIGLSFLSYATILPLFVSKLTSHPLPFALLAVIGQAGWYLPQLFTAGPTEKLARKKPIVINLGFFTERLPLWVLPIAALLSIEYPTAALLLFFLFYAMFGFGAGVIAPAWADLVARCFPVSRRGRVFGITAFVGTGTGALGAIFSGWLLENYPYPFNFAITFFLAALAITLSWAALAFAREPVQPVPENIRRQRSWSLPKIVAILRGDHNFRNYLVVRLLASFGNMAAGFITVAAIQRWSVADSAVGFYTAALLVGQTMGNLIAGIVADRYGHRRSLIVGFMFGMAAYVLAWFSPAPAWFNVVFFLVGAMTGMIIVSGVLMNMEFSRPEHRPTYIGIANTTAGIGNVIAPLIGGALALAGYDLLFGLSAVFGLAALLVLVMFVRDPRGQTEFFDASV